jgi:hypothetical protein
MGSAWVNPLIDDIWDGLWHRGLQHSCVAPCCAPFPSAENLGEAETFTLQVDFIGADPSHRPQPSPSNWTREAGVARKFGSAPARDGWFTWLRLGLTTAMDLFGMGNMVKNLINHGKTEVSQF